MTDLTTYLLVSIDIGEWPALLMAVVALITSMFALSKSYFNLKSRIDQQDQTIDYLKNSNAKRAKDIANIENKMDEKLSDIHKRISNIDKKNTEIYTIIKQNQRS